MARDRVGCRFVVAFVALGETLDERGACRHATTIFLVASIVVGTMAVGQRNRAERQRQLAEHERRPCPSTRG